MLMAIFPVRQWEQASVTLPDQTWRSDVEGLLRRTDFRERNPQTGLRLELIEVRGPRGILRCQSYHRWIWQTVPRFRIHLSALLNP